MKKRKIKIIGDSLAAGGGSSLCRKTDVVVFEDNGIQYLKCVAPNSWWGLLQTYPNRIHHTDQVVAILREVAGKKAIQLIDIYQHILDYLDKNCLSIDDIMYAEGCVNDGLHPADMVHRLMFEKVVGS